MVKHTKPVRLSGTYTTTMTDVTNTRLAWDGTTPANSFDKGVPAPDVTPPAITAPADVGAEATGPATVVALGTPTVSANSGGPPKLRVWLVEDGPLPAWCVPYWPWWARPWWSDWWAPELAL